MHPLIEVRQVVVAGPPLDLARVAIGSTVAIGPAAIGLLQPLLVLAFEFLLEDDAPNVGALLQEPFLLAQVRAIELAVVRQLALAADAGKEGLLAAVVAIPTVGFQEVMPAAGEGHDRLAAVEPDEAH